MDKTKDISPKKLLTGNLGIVLGLVILAVVFTVLSSILLTPSNIRNTLIRSGTNAIIAVGMIYVTISGNTNTSVGASLALSSCVGATLTVGTNDVGLGVVAVLLTGTLLELFNGSLVAYLGFPPFTVTSSTMWLFRGMAYLYTGSQAVVGLPQGMTGFATGSILYIPSIVWLITTAYIIGYVALQKTTVERRVCAVGGNSESTGFSGINVERATLAIFALSGFCVTFNGIVCIGRLNSGQLIAGQSYEMYVIAATVIDRTSLIKGGIGSMVDTLTGAILISVLQNRLIILSVNTYWQQVCMDVVLLLAMDLGRFRKSIK